MNRQRCELRCGLLVWMLFASVAGAANEDDLERVLERLGSGTTEDRLEALASFEDALLAAKMKTAPDDFERLDRLFRRLKGILRDQPDDWIAVQVLEHALASFGETAVVASLATDALRSPSPNLRSRGVRWFTVATDGAVVPDLQVLWRSEIRPWIRADLMVALAHQGARGHRDDLAAMAGGEDARLARAAVRALREFHEPSIVPALVAAAERGGRELRLAALQQLASYVDSPDALDAVLEASLDPDEALRSAVVMLLTGFGDPRAAQRLERIVGSSDEPHLRASALHALSIRDDPRVVELATKLNRDADEVEQVREAARAILLSRDLILPPNEPTYQSGVGMFSDEFISSCGFGAPWMPAGEVSFGRILPAPGTRSVRCWPAPGIEGNALILKRLLGGVGVEIRDYFERDDDLWLLVATDDGDECWQRADHVEVLHERAAGQELGDEDDSDEFDLPAEELDSGAAAILRDAQLLDVIEEGDRVVGIVLRAPTSEPSRAILESSKETAPPALRGYILALLKRLDSTPARDRGELPPFGA